MTLRKFFVVFSMLALANAAWAGADQRGDARDLIATESETASLQSEIANLTDATEINLLKARVIEEAAVVGVEVSDVDISQRIAPNEFGVLESSCTATATVNLAGVGSVELSATASTCAEAANMLSDYIASLIEP